MFGNRRQLAKARDTGTSLIYISWYINDYRRPWTPLDVNSKMGHVHGRFAGDEGGLLPVRQLQDHVREPISLDLTLGDDGDCRLGDFIEDFQATDALDAVSFTLLQDQLQSVLATLTTREAGIVRLRFGLTDGQPRTLEDIAHVYGVTRERIRQIETKTMAKLRHPTRTHALRDYLH